MHPPELDPVKSEWNFVEVWIDPMLFPPCILLLQGDPAGSYRVHDPAENYKGHLEKLQYSRIWNQVGPDEAMSLNCWVPLESEFFEAP
jgi:hypothetical protein